jgi:hypothetical protein
MEIEEYHIDEVLNRFAEFLRGCGFQIKGEESLAIVNDFETQYTPDVEEEINVGNDYTFYAKDNFYKQAPLEDYKINYYSSNAIPGVPAQSENF